MNASFSRRHALRLLSAALAAATLAAPALAGHDSLRRGKIFTSTNAPAGNEVLVYDQQDGGAPSFVTRVAAQGLGTGAGLGSQGAVTLSRNGRWLFVVNAGSNSVSTFALGPHGIVRTSTVDSGGTRPTSVTERDGLVYVLNAGDPGNVSGFRNRQGVLEPLADGVRPLSAAGGGTAPAQVGFSREGDALIVTERATGLITGYEVRQHGRLSGPVTTPSANATPFGFAFTRRDTLVVSEAAGGAPLASTVSSYRFDEHAPARPIGVSLAVPTGQTSACWIAVTPDGRFAYSSNAASSSVSSFFVSRRGALTRLQSVAGSTGNGGALDAAVSADGQQLHVLASGSLQIVSFEVGDDGSLTPLGATGGLPAGTAGLAAN